MRERDVAAVLDELYTLPPSDFVARREALAAAAKAAGHLDGARRIQAARRPTLAAWAANMLLRSQPQESQRFLELGGLCARRTTPWTPRGSMSCPSSGGVAALSRQAAHLAQEAGHRLSVPVRQDVESTLRAVLTDPDAADRWAGGCSHPAVGLFLHCTADRCSAAAEPGDGFRAAGAVAGEG